MTLIILCIRNLCQVSIYTTAKVMTSTDIRQYRTNYISIHTTAKVVTPPESGTSFPIEYFNPHHREGGDWCDVRWFPCTIEHFNPHHREGGDNGDSAGQHDRCISIHTTAKVVTGSYVTHVGIYVDFNPHHREGGDNAHHIKLHYQKISIHTTAKVVTNETDGADSNAFISIHTTAKVVTI